MSTLDDLINKLPASTQDVAWDVAWIVQGSVDQAHEGYMIAKNYLFSSLPESTSSSVESVYNATTTTFFSLGGGAAPPPPPPPPPAPPAGWFSTQTLQNTYDSTDRFVRAHPYAVGGTAVVLGGVSVAWVGLGAARRERVWETMRAQGDGMKEGWVQGRRERHEEKKAGERPLNRDGHRMEVVVLLGADASPLGFPLALYLESKGFIVVASVSTSQAGSALERLANGFVRAIVMDASEASSVDPFLSSLKGVLTLKFPINSPGDPYASSASTVPVITSVISLLALASPPPPDLTDAAPLSLQAPLLTPLAIVTNLLPKLFEPLPSSLIPAHLRASTNSSDTKLALQRTTFSTSTLAKKIVVLLPAVGSLAGPGLTSSKVTNDAVRTAFKTLSSEIAVAAKNTFDGEKPSLVKVEVIDLGFVEAVRKEAVSWSVNGLKVAGGRLLGWLKSWVGGRRVWSGFEVLERSMWRTLTSGGGARGRGAFGTLTFGFWTARGESYGPTFGSRAVGAGSWTYTYLPALIPTSIMNLLLQRASTTTPRPSVTARRAPQSDAARAAGSAAAQRQQSTATARPTSEPSDDELHTTSDTDSVPSSMDASMSGLGDSWVHDPSAGRQGGAGAGGGGASMEGSWVDGTWARA